MRVFTYFFPVLESFIGLVNGILFLYSYGLSGNYFKNPYE